MEPIISPWLIYLIAIADALNRVLFIGMLLSGAGVVAVLLALGAMVSDEADEKYIQVGGKYLFKFIVATMIFCVLFAAIPSQNMMFAIAGAKLITPDNIGTAVDAGVSIKKDLKQDVLDVISALSKGNEEKGEEE